MVLIGRSIGLPVTSSISTLKLPWQLHRAEKIVTPPVTGNECVAEFPLPESVNRGAACSNPGLVVIVGAAVMIVVAGAAVVGVVAAALVVAGAAVVGVVAAAVVVVVGAAVVVVVGAAVVVVTGATVVVVVDAPPATAITGAIGLPEGALGARPVGTESLG